MESNISDGSGVTFTEDIKAVLRTYIHDNIGQTRETPTTPVTAGEAHLPPKMVVTGRPSAAGFGNKNRKGKRGPKKQCGFCGTPACSATNCPVLKGNLMQVKLTVQTMATLYTISTVTVTPSLVQTIDAKPGGGRIYAIHAKARVNVDNDSTSHTTIFKCEIFKSKSLNDPLAKDCYVTGQTLVDWTSSERGPSLYIASQTHRTLATTSVHKTNQHNVAAATNELQAKFHSRPTKSQLNGAARSIVGSSTWALMRIGRFTGDIAFLVMHDRPTYEILCNVFRRDGTAGSSTITANQALSDSLRYPVVSAWLNNHHQFQFIKPTGIVIHETHDHIAFTPHGFLQDRQTKNAPRMLVKVECRKIGVRKATRRNAITLAEIQHGLIVTGCQECVILQCDM